MNKKLMTAAAVVAGVISVVCVAPAIVFVNGVEQAVSVNDPSQNSNVASISNHLDMLQDQYTVSSNHIDGLSTTQGVLIANLSAVSNHLDILDASYSYTSNLVMNISNIVQEITIIELSNRVDGIAATQMFMIADAQFVSNHLDTLQGQYTVSSNHIDGLSTTQGLVIAGAASVSNHLDTLQSQYTVSSNHIDGLSTTQGLVVASLGSVSNHLDTLQGQYTVSSNHIDGLSTTQGLVIAGAASVSNHLDTLQSQYTASSNTANRLATAIVLSPSAGTLTNALFGGADQSVTLTLAQNLTVGTNYIVGNATTNGIRWIVDGGTNVFQIFQGSSIGYEVRF